MTAILDRFELQTSYLPYSLPYTMFDILLSLFNVRGLDIPQLEYGDLILIFPTHCLVTFSLCSTFVASPFLSLSWWSYYSLPYTVFANLLSV